MSTDRLRTSLLDTEHLDEDRLLPERVVELEAAGHPVDVLEHHLVVNDKPDDDSTGYLVAEIETTPVPREDAKPITIFVCHCAHANYRVFDWSSVGGPDGADPGEDKHVDRVLRSEKREREVDDDQVTLADGGQLLEPDHDSDDAGVGMETADEETSALVTHSVVTESVTPADPTSLPDFDVYCSVIDASNTTVSRLVQEASA